MTVNIDRMKLFGYEHMPAFAHEVIRPWSEAQFDGLQSYITEHYWCGNASVNVFRVIGTCHPDYAGGTWIDLLMHGKRMDSVNLPLFQTNPGYYLETIQKTPMMYYRSIDGGSLYIGDDGNHRTCIARFDFFRNGLTTLHGVTVDDYRIDWEFKKLVEELQSVVEKKRIPVFISVRSEVIERQDTSGWKLDKFKLVADVRDSRNNGTERLDFKGLEIYLNSLKIPKWKIWQR